MTHIDLGMVERFCRDDPHFVISFIQIGPYVMMQLNLNDHLFLQKNQFVSIIFSSNHKLGLIFHKNVLFKLDRLAHVSLFRVLPSHVDGRQLQSINYTNYFLRVDSQTSTIFISSSHIEICVKYHKVLKQVLQLWYCHVVTSQKVRTQSLKQNFNCEYSILRFFNIHYNL